MELETTGTVGIKTGQVQATVVGIIKNSVLSSIFLTDAGSGYEGIPTVTVSSPLSVGIGTYHINERVVGSDSGTEAFLHKVGTKLLENYKLHKYW